MNMVGQSRSLEIIICMPKLREPMVIRLTFSFPHWNRESKTDDPVIKSSLAFMQFRNKNIRRLTLPHHTHFAPPYPTGSQVFSSVICMGLTLFSLLL